MTGTQTTAWLLGGLVVGGVIGVATPAAGTIPYTPVGPFSEGQPGIGPGLIDVKDVYGKEYSHDRDHEISGGGVTPDPHQVVAWDGIGGVTDGQDFSPVLPTPFLEYDIDALANHGDFAFSQLVDEERAHLIFSLDREVTGFSLTSSFPVTVPLGTPPGVPLKNGNVVGGAGELSYELGTFGGANAPETQGLWADQASINGMPLPDDIDGVEVWGPEPAVDADADKFSLRIDGAAIPPTGGVPTSVFNGDGSPYIDLPTITAAVTSLLGPLPSQLPAQEVINLDALMVEDVAGSDMDFGRDPTNGTLDRILFSIDQVVDPSDPDKYYATGSELFLLDAAGGVSYLTHGGHTWDHTYALMTFTRGEPNQVDEYWAYDIDAIEAVGEFAIPEPGAAALLLTGGAFMLRRRTA
ncbi:MAG: PEP-CTERM sorting domain-containing protein [Planctomycetota bacterium]